MNQEDLGDLYDELSPAVYRYAFRLLGDADLAEDCVAETFSRLLQTLHASQIENYKAYLFRVAHNWAMDQYRRKPVVSLDEMELSGDDEKIDPSSIVSQRLAQEKVRQAILKLPVEQQQVIMFRFYEDYSHTEIAQALGKTCEATRALQHRAVQTLKYVLRLERNGSDHD